MHYNRSVLLYQLYLQSFTLRAFFILRSAYTSYFLKCEAFTPRAFLYCEAFTPRGSDSQHRKASQSFQNHRQQL